MDRNNREATRRASAATTMVTSSNGLPRRRHRTNSLRDSPEDDVAMELIQEPSSRLRDRGGLKKDRDHRDRDRSSNRAKRQRRADRLIHGSSTNREDIGGGGGGGGGLGEDSSEESVNDDEDDEEDDGGGAGGGSYRMLPPNPVSNNHLLHHHRKSYPPTTIDKVVFRPSAPVWKPGDEMIGVCVPRKARSAATKRGGGGGGGVEIVGGGLEQIQRQASSSPVRQSVVSALTAAPMSPSSSNSVRKKIKANNGSKPRPPPPKSSSKSTSSSNPEELDFEIAEVLYGLMTQSSSSKKEMESNESREVNNANNKSISEAKSSRVSSPISNSPSVLPPQNSSSSSAPPLSAVAPKRKRPRQVVENMVVGSFGVRGSSPIIPTKLESDHPPPKIENSSPKDTGSVAENGSGVPFDLGNLVNSQGLLPSSSSSEPEEVKPLMMEEAAAGGSPKKESAGVVRLLEDSNKCEDVTKTATTNLNSPGSEMEKPKEEKFHIDLMAPPPQLRSSPERENEVDFTAAAAADDKTKVSNVNAEMLAKEEDNKGGKTGKDEAVNVAMEEERKAKSIAEEAQSQKPVENNKGRNIDLQLDLEKPDNREIGNNKLQPQVQKQQQQQQPPAKVTREAASHTEKTVQSSSLSLPMSVASWPGGLPPMGYMAPLKGVVSMDGSAMASPPMQPLFSQPRAKRCATHCYIARNIHYLQQCMKVNPFWPAAAGTASLFGAKPGNLNVMPSADLHGNTAGRGMNPVQDKGQSLAIFPGMIGKDKGPQGSNIVDPAQRKQQILLQQALPPVAPNNILHGPAFIFPLNQQQATVAAAGAARPGSGKSPTTAGSSNASSSASVSSSAAAAAATAMNFAYPTLPGNETQYLAILQNNAYPFPIPAVGAPPNYRGTHAQAMPMFNGSFFSSQMIHPSQLQQQQAPPSQSHQMQQANQNTSISSISSGSSSSHKHLQSQQQRPQVGAVNGGSGGGNLHNYPATKNRVSQSQQQQQPQNQHISPSQQSRQLESEVGVEDSPSTFDSRLSRATINVYGQNFTMPIHPQNFAMMTPASLAGATSASGIGNPSEKKQQQHPQQLALKGGVDSLPPQTFATFTPINGPTTTPGIDISSMAQNHAIILQNFSDATRQNNHMISAAAAAAQVAQQKKNFRIGEDGKTGVSDSSNNTDEERKALGSKATTTVGQSTIAFSRDLTEDSGPVRPTRSPIPNSVGSLNTQNSHLQATQLMQQHQQQLIQLQKHQQQQQQQHQQQLAAARSKTPATSNGSVYSEHLTSVSSVPAKFQTALSAFPQNLIQSSNSSSPTQSPQWKNTGRPTNSQAAPSALVSSTTSSLKNLPQQQARVQQSNISQISFGANQKSSAATHGQQQQTPGNNQQSNSPPIVVGSPTTSSISKGASGSPRTTSASTSNKAGQASALSSQQAKNSPSAASSQKSSPVGGRNVSSILGNHHINSSSSSGAKQMQQQQQLPTNMQQGQLFFSNHYVQAQSPHSTSTGSTVSGSNFYIQRRHSEQQKQPPQPLASSATSSTGMLLISTSTTDPAKGITAVAASNMKGGSLTSQGILHAAQFAAQSQGNPHQLIPAGFSYVHPVPNAVQVKQAEQKQPSGNVNMHACWQPDKK